MIINVKTPHLLIPLLMVSLIAASSCSKSRSEPAQFTESAKGIWEAGCQNFGINNEYGRAKLQVNEDTFEFINTFYEDPRCTRATLRFTSGGALAKHNTLRREDSTQRAEIDFLVEQVSAVVLKASKQQQFNDNATCELDNWEVDVSVDVSNCVDIADSQVPRTEYDIYSSSTENHPSGVSTRVLYTGILRGASEAERPSQLDLQNPYWRIGDVPSEP